MPPRTRHRRPRIVVDTSVLVSGIAGFKESYVRRRNLCADLLYKWAARSNFIWLITEDILDEYKEVLKRLSVRPYLIGCVVNLIRERAEEILARSSTRISPDPKDDAFCICAERGRADFILTLNPKDFPQDRLRAKVVSPAEFLR